MITVEHPLRHPLQAMVSLGQLYGDILYYATSLFDHYYLGISYSRPEAYYFWGYYFLMNFFWIVIPGCKSFAPLGLVLLVIKQTDVSVVLLYNSVSITGEAFKQLQKLGLSKKSA